MELVRFTNPEENGGEIIMLLYMQDLYINLLYLKVAMYYLQVLLKVTY